MTRTLGHVMVFRMVAGAVMNAAHHHPNWRLTRGIASSIAKRAAGTLTADWSKALAAHRRSGMGDREGDAHWPPGVPNGNPRGGHSKRPPLRLAWNRVSVMIGEAERARQTERVEALRDVARMLSGLMTATERKAAGWRR